MALLHLEEIEGQHRNQGERQGQRSEQGEHDGQRHRGEQLALQPFQRQQRQEDQRNDGHAGSDRSGDLGRCDEDVVKLAGRGVLRIGEPLHHVFDHHHGAVDQDADGNGQPAQAHQVGGQADRAHQDESEQRGHRQGQGHDDRSAKIAQEQEQQDHDQDGRFEQGLLHRPHGARNQVGAVIERGHGHPRGEAWLDVLKRLLDALHHLAGVSAAQPDNQALHGLALAVLGNRAIAGQGPVSDRSHVAHPDHAPAFAANHHRGQVLQSADCPGRADDQRLLARNQAARAVVAIAPLDRVGQVAHG